MTTGTRTVAIAVLAGVLLASAGAWAALGRSQESAEESYSEATREESPLLDPADAEPTVPLSDAIGGILSCRGQPASECAGAVYVWSPLMPLSRDGIAEITRTTDRLGIDLAVVDASELEARSLELFPTEGRAAGKGGALSPEDSVAVRMIEAGATLHQPSLLIHRSGELVSGAILGYKTAEAYRAMVEERLAARSPVGEAPQPRPAWGAVSADSLQWMREFPVQGRPGAYFRAVPGRRTLAFEAQGTIYLMDLEDGDREIGPGYIDFVPTPDGRLFVTPTRGNRGLAFYDAEEVFRAAERGSGDNVEPVYLDRSMRDQYPSVGVLSGGGDTRLVVYRVLTSWFDRIVIRDYEVRFDGRSPTVTPLADPVVACPQISIPILSHQGTELAGRDEASATTKIFRLGAGGECQEVEDLGLQTGKVAWSPDGSRLAFAIPRGAVRDGTGTLWYGDDDTDLAGILVYDRSTGRSTQIEGSEDANRLSFPDFIGQDSLVYLLSPESTRRSASRFRMVCCFP